MARFDVYEYGSKNVPYLLDVQADLLSDLNTRVVIPLVPENKAGQEALPKLKPIIQIKGKNHILITTDIGTLRKSSLGKFITNIQDNHRDEIIDALDFLFQGF